MTNLSELLPSGGGAKEFDAVASGTLPTGQTVILKADGKVEAVSISPAGLGTEASLSFGGNQGPSVCKLTDTTFLMTGRDSSNSNQATYVIGTVSNGSITFGSKALIGSIGSGVEHLQAFPLTTNKFVVIYKDGSDGNKGKAIVGEVSGGSASFGSVVTFETGQTSLNNVNAGVALSSTKFIIAFEDASNSSYAKTIICDVSGTTITIGTAYTYNTSNSSKYGIVDKLSSTAVVIAFSETPQSERGRALIGIYSGTSISYGSQTTYDTASVVSHSIVAMSETEVVVSYIDKGFLNYGRSIVLTTNIGAATVSVGATTDFNIACMNYAPASVKLNATQFAVAFSPDQTPYTQREFKIGTINAGTITFGSAIQVHNGNSGSTTYLALLGTKDVIFSYVTATVFAARDYQLESTNVSDFIGITSEAIANTATGKVNPQGGVATAQALNSGVVGTPVPATPNNGNRNSLAYDSNSNRIALSYADGSNNEYGTCVVGQVDSANSSITFGTAVVFNTAGTNDALNATTFDSSSNKIVVAFRDTGNSNKGYARVGTIDPSNNSISFPSASVEFEAGAVRNIVSTFDSSTSRIVIAYEDEGNSEKGTAIVGQVSGNTISFGAAAVFNDADTQDIDIAYGGNKVVIVFEDVGNSKKNTAIVGTVDPSDNSITYGSEAVYDATTASKLGNAIAYDATAQKFVIAYCDTSAGESGKALTGTVSGTNITFGTVVQFATEVDLPVATYDSGLGQVIIAYGDNDNSRAATALGANVSGTDLTFTTALLVDGSTGYKGPLSLTYDSTANKTVTSYRDGGDTNKVDVTVFTVEGLGSFTINSTYYVQNNGNLSTTSSSVTAGKAISTTQLILNGAS